MCRQIGVLTPSRHLPSPDSGETNAAEAQRSSPVFLAPWRLGQIAPNSSPRPEAMVTPRALQTLRASRASADLEKRLDCGAFTAALVPPGAELGRCVDKCFTVPIIPPLTRSRPSARLCGPSTSPNLFCGFPNRSSLLNPPPHCFGAASGVAFKKPNGIQSFSPAAARHELPWVSVLQIIHASPVG